MSRYIQKFAWLVVFALISSLPACLSDPPLTPGDGGDGGDDGGGIPTGVPFQLRSVAFGDGAFVVVGTESLDLASIPLAYRSTDGVTWEEITINESAGLAGVAFGNGRFVAAGGRPFFPGSPTRSVLLTSTDGGSTWLPTITDPNWVYRDILFTDGDFYSLILDDAAAVNAHRVVRASDGEDWTIISNLVAANPELAFEAGRFLLWNQSTQVVATSTNGADYTATAIPDLNRVFFVGHDGNRFVGTGAFDCCNGNSPSQVDFFDLTSNDATTWTATPNASGPFILDIATGNDMIIALGTSNEELVSGAILSSSDGIEWTQEVLVEDVFSGDVFFGNGRFVVSSGREIHSSVDGLNWTTFTVPN